MDVKQLSEERFDLFQKVYSGQIPKRVPFILGPAFEASLEYAIQTGVLGARTLVRCTR